MKKKRDKHNRKERRRNLARAISAEKVREAKGVKRECNADLLPDLRIKFIGEDGVPVPVSDELMATCLADIKARYKKKMEEDSLIISPTLVIDERNKELL